jgi:CcmD family protein
VIGYLFAAYMVIWTLLFAFLLHITRTQRRLGRRLDILAAEIRDHGGSPPDSRS